MAFAAATNMAAPAPHAREDAQGVLCFELGGGVRLYVGTGDPNGNLTGNAGDLCIYTDGPGFKQNTDGSTTWAVPA